MMSSKKIPTGQPPVIILTGGGSGGHITPILSLARELRRLQPDAKLIFVRLRGEKIKIDESLFDAVEYVSSGKLRRFSGRHRWLGMLNPKTWILNICDSFRLLRGIRQAKKLIGKHQPSVMFSKGGYVALPVAWAAHRAGVPIITHDSDVTPGLTNRVVGRWAKWHATGWPKGHYGYPASSLRYTGIPINPSIQHVTPKLLSEYRKKLELDAQGLVLLVGGAGLGSATLNRLTLESAPELFKNYPNLEIIHLTGHDHLVEVQSVLTSWSQDQQKRYTALDFSDKFHEYCGAADLIVSRAGATSIAEYAAQGKACILIPADWLPGGQQTENAKMIAEAEAAVIVGNNISTNDYIDTVKRLLDSSFRRKELGQHLHKLSKAGASTQLAKLILETASTYEA